MQFMTRLPIRLCAAASVCVLSLCAATASWAGTTNDVPSCYAANKLKAPAAVPQQELFLMVDQTTQLDANLKAQVNENLARLVKPGSAFTLAEFSAFTQGHYTDVVTRGYLEQPVAQKDRDDISERLLRNFDACMQGQLGYGRKLAASKFIEIENGATNDLAKSDILASLKDLSDRVRNSPSQDRVVFLVSDMLENSSISSFYAHNAVRKIDPSAELKKVADASLFGDFGGARVYVLGAGILTEDADKTKAYRDPKTMAALRQFWSSWFEKSNAKLVEFGQPALLSPIN
ncbi:hypothetical protein [Paraburkholderia susongensis]|uniref:VWFA domain-containing protein n=1 Tax=Paraburkholderia susongensis TaxID=1515439 RepID=A0A1X7IDX6_9BURK|nr:hypothetical protein [Paraburkholderia susongensis]SMG12491.1 hypothetical protein SAMN06265784_101566 [Paraburkholderia susongensis]